jgi:hypothetical protein
MRRDWTSTWEALNRLLNDGEPRTIRRLCDDLGISLADSAYVQTKLAQMLAEGRVKRRSQPRHLGFLYYKDDTCPS